MRKLLLSIKPKYVHQILDGTKKVEYRKKTHSEKDVEWVLIYESAPTMRVVGEFHINGVIKASPRELWDVTHHVGGICEEDYFIYFSKHVEAYAYIIGELRVFDEPKTLQEFGIIRAPQSFQYIEVNE